MFGNRAVDVYLSGLRPLQRQALSALRELIFETLPDAEECIAKNRPCYRGNGAVCAFARCGRYMSLYIFDGEVLEKHRAKLGGLDSGKYYIHFQSFDELPKKAISAMLLEVREKNRASRLTLESS
jgi:uncharacterized protein YdhG (YjbR/CyaY superfamily)